jgi:ATP-dependent Clp protease adaptor protein ClpS
MSKEQVKEKTFSKEKISNLKHIVVYNDDINSFEHVIGSFISVLEIPYDTAIEKVFTIHNQGKCDVKSGTYKELEPFALRLMELKISLKIE